MHTLHIIHSRHGIIKHYLVALDLKSRKITVNGKKYFNNIPTMVEVGV